MGFMSFLDPGGVGKAVLNPGGINNWMMPYVAPVAGAAGGIIGAYYGGPAGAALGSSIGTSGGEQLGRYLAKNDYHRDPWSGDVLKSAATKGAIAGGASYLGASLLGGGSSAATSGTGPPIELGSTISQTPMEFGGPQVAPVVSNTSSAAASQTPNTSSLLDSYGGPDYTPAPQVEAPSGPSYNPNTTGYEYVRPSLITGPDSLNYGIAPETTSTAPTLQTTREGGGFMNTLKDYVTSRNLSMAAPMLLGAGMNAYANYANQGAQNKGLAEYRDATSWTPEKTSAYMGNLQNYVGSIYGAEEEAKKKNVADMMASAGRGGGAYGGASEKLAREKRSAIAKAMAQGALVTSTPPSWSPSAFPQTSALGQTALGASGVLGNYSNAMMQMAMLQQLYNNQKAA
jgi:hypothetical protein